MLTAVVADPILRPALVAGAGWCTLWAHRAILEWAGVVYGWPLDPTAGWACRPGAVARLAFPLPIGPFGGVTIGCTRASYDYIFQPFHHLRCVTSLELSMSA